ncbi:MAG: hypothetical protein AAGA30_07005, partial [Planctomycetota bacterium]
LALVVRQLGGLLFFTWIHKKRINMNISTLKTHLVLAALSISPMVACGQTEDVEMLGSESSAIIVSSTADENGITGTNVLALDASELGDTPMFFSSGAFGGDAAFSFDMSGSSFSLLNNPSVQKDLQLVDEQMDQINAINKEFSEKIKEKIEAMKGEDGGFRFNTDAGFGDLIGDLRNQQQEQIESILLPNQQNRLQQVSRQMKLKRMGSERGLTQVLAEELEITDEQKERIKTKSEELQKELETKIAELKNNAKKELMQELTQEQRNKLEDLLGDDFVTKEEDSKNRFPGIRRMIQKQRASKRDF